jgi:phenylpropionate dioxygenase-like ring-hydroxylating dioxygenase large terminal subunit
MFLKNTWYVAAWGREIVDNAPFGRTICNEKVVLFRGPDGKVAALEDRCSHRGLPLSCGKVTSGQIECGYHGLRFNAAGSCMVIPGQQHVPSRADIKRYPIVEKDELVWIWMGEATDADATAIPDFPWHNDYTNWPHKNDMCYVESNYLLVVDNLMDLSHIGFVHTKTIGGNASDHVNAKMKVERKPTGVKLTRLMFDAIPPATYLKGVPFKGKIDRWQEFELVAPSNVLQWSGGIDAGNGAEDPAKRVGGVQIRIFHGITPETDTTSFYFWSAAHGHCTEDPMVTERMYQDIDVTIKEDAVVLGEQEKNLTRYPDRDYVDIEADNARLQARRYIERRIADEQAAPLPETA